MFLPKEHGAYAQVACPLFAALAVTGPRGVTVLLVVAVVAAFVMHEPVLVALGRRGRAVRQDHGASARRWIGGLAALAAISGGLAVLQMPNREARLLLLLPAIPGALVFAAAWQEAERESVGQVGVALASSLTLVPICASAGVPLSAATAMASVFAVNFVLASLAVRVVVLRVRGGGDPRASASARRTLVVVALVAAFAGLSYRVVGGALPPLAMAALLVGIGTPAHLAWAPPPASQLRRIGWKLVATSAAVTLLLVAAYRGM